MGDEAVTKFSWVIKNFSSLKSEKIYSDPFVIGDCKWRIMAFPKGNNQSDYLSLYLVVADYELLPSGWRRHATFSLTIVSQITEKHSDQVKDTQHWFNVKEPDWGFTYMFPLNELNAKYSGYMKNGELKIIVEVEILEVIGQFDVPENIYVKGFHVLPSQVKTVNRLFGSYPDIAIKFGTVNQYLKKGYMSVLLSLTETLRKSPKSIPNDDLADAYAALEYLTCAGFKLDWLEKKLDQVSKKKGKVQVGEARMQEIEEELKDLKRKSTDLKAQLEKEKAEVLDANAPLLCDDF